MSSTRYGSARDPEPSPEGNPLAEHYLAQLEEAQRALEQEKREKGLVETREGRDLMAALRESDWLGLRLLTHVKLSGMAVSALAKATDQDIDFVAATMARLLRFGAAELQGKLFTSTRKGEDILKNIEANTGVELASSPEYAEAGI